MKKILLMLIMGVVIAFVNVQAEAAVKVLAETSMKRGLDWMKEMQNEDGSWPNADYPAMTALGLWAFTRSDHPDKDEICRKAADFVASLVQEDGGIYRPRGFLRRSGGLSTYNTAICMTALHAYDKSKYAPIVLKAREFVAGSQLTGDSPGAGGFGYEHPERSERNRADLSNTGWAAMAMRYTQDAEDMRPAGSKSVDLDWDAAIKYAEKLQNQNKDDAENYGCFGYSPDGARGGKFADKKTGEMRLAGFGSMTYAGLETMIYAQVDRTDPKVRSALEWAGRHWSVDKNPGMGTKGLFYYYNVMGKALSVSGVDSLKKADGSGDIEWKKEVIEKLASGQRQHGSWVNHDNHFWEGDAVLVTAYAILTLEYVTGR